MQLRLGFRKGGDEDQDRSRVKSGLVVMDFETMIHHEHIN